MKKLKDLGYKYKPKDGRKRFTGARIKSPELMNKDVIVLDYEKDVPTKNGPDCYKAGTRRQGEKVFYQSGGNPFYL